MQEKQMPPHTCSVLSNVDCSKDDDKLNFLNNNHSIIGNSNFFLNNSTSQTTATTLNSIQNLFDQSSLVNNFEFNNSYPFVDITNNLNSLISIKEEQLDEDFILSPVFSELVNNSDSSDNLKKNMTNHHNSQNHLNNMIIESPQSLHDFFELDSNYTPLGNGTLSNTSTYSHQNQQHHQQQSHSHHQNHQSYQMNAQLVDSIQYNSASHISQPPQSAYYSHPTTSTNSFSAENNHCKKYSYLNDNEDSNQSSFSGYSESLNANSSSNSTMGVGSNKQRYSSKRSTNEKRYGPIVIRPRKNPAPTLASGRKSK
jgi:hypothetical protein